MEGTPDEWNVSGSQSVRSLRGLTVEMFIPFNEILSGGKQFLAMFFAKYLEWFLLAKSIFSDILFEVHLDIWSCPCVIQFQMIVFLSLMQFICRTNLFVLLRCLLCLWGKTTSYQQSIFFTVWLNRLHPSWPWLWPISPSSLDEPLRQIGERSCHQTLELHYLALHLPHDAASFRQLFMCIFYDSPSTKTIQCCTVYYCTIISPTGSKCFFMTRHELQPKQCILDDDDVRGEFYFFLQ